MGGEITLVWRDESGRVEAWKSNTNSLPYRIHDPAMFTDPTALLTMWFGAIAEAAESTKDDDYTYYKRLGLAYPTEYGIVVIDQVTQQILSCQEYTRPGGRPLSWIMLDWYNPSPEGTPPEDDDTDASLLRDYLEVGRVLGFETFKETGRVNDRPVFEEENFTCEELFGTKTPTPEQVFAFLYERIVDVKWVETSPGCGHTVPAHPDYDQWQSAQVRFDMSPWKLTHWKTMENWVRMPDGMNALRAELAKIGIPIDEGRWDEYTKVRLGGGDDEG